MKTRTAGGLVAALTMSIAMMATMFTGSASAHVTVAATTPQAGKTVASPRTVKVIYMGQIRKGTLKVFAANGRKVSIGNGGVDPRNVKSVMVKLPARLAAGRYTARWSVVAGDGHRQSGAFKFRIR